MLNKKQELFRAHLDSGLYDDTINGVNALKRTALGVAEYNVDFVRTAVNWSGNTKYTSIAMGNELKFNVFGQIAGFELGTCVSAAGNHNDSGPNGEVSSVCVPPRAAADLVSRASSVCCNL